MFQISGELVGLSGWFVSLWLESVHTSMHTREIINFDYFWTIEMYIPSEMYSLSLFRGPFKPMVIWPSTVSDNIHE